MRTKKEPGTVAHVQFHTFSLTTEPLVEKMEDISTLVEVPGFHETQEDVEARFDPVMRRSFVSWEKFGGSSFDAQLIVPRIWLGSILAAFDRSSLANLNINHALTVARGMVEFRRFTDNPKFESWFLTHAAVEVNDVSSESILDNLEDGLRYIDECIANKSGDILIHCAAGMSRSASVVIAYLMTRQNMTLDDALKHVKIIRPIVMPNQGFFAQLRLLEKCKGNIAIARDGLKTGRFELALKPYSVAN